MVKIAIAVNTNLSPNPNDKGNKSNPKPYDGMDLFWACYVHYQIGGGNPFHVNANIIDYSGFSQSDLTYDPKKDVYYLNLIKGGNFIYNQNARALGKISLTMIDWETFIINKYDYDFNIEWNNEVWANGYLTYRNLFTTIAGFMHGNTFDDKPLPIIGNLTLSSQFGGPFPIIFHGKVKIRK